MEIIGKTNRTGEYIVIITGNEIEKVMSNSFDSLAHEKMQDLKPGATIDLTLGYKYYQDICQICKRMQETHEAFDKARNTLLSFTKLLIDNAIKGDKL